MVTAGTFEGGDFNVIRGAVRADRLRRRPYPGRGRAPGRKLVQEGGWETRLAFFDEYYVHIDLMVVPIAKKLTAYASSAPNPRWSTG